jgi:hypothetical protein
MAGELNRINQRLFVKGFPQVGDRTRLFRPLPPVRVVVGRLMKMTSYFAPDEDSFSCRSRPVIPGKRRKYGLEFMGIKMGKILDFGPIRSFQRHTGVQRDAGVRRLRNGSRAFRQSERGLQGIGTHFFHHTTTVHLDGLFPRPELEGNLLDRPGFR